MSDRNYTPDLMGGNRERPQCDRQQRAGKQRWHAATASRPEPFRLGRYLRRDLGDVAVRRVVGFGLLVLSVAACLLLTSCKPGNYNTGLDIRVRSASPEEQASAALIEADVDRKFKENQVAFDRAMATLELEKESLPKIVEANNTALIMATEADSRARVSMADADARAKVAQADAAARSAMATGLSASVAVAALGLGVAISVPMLVLAGAVYGGILLVTAARQINARARAVVVTAYFNSTRVDYLVMQDEDGHWHIQNTMDDERSLMSQSKAVSHTRPHLLQAAQIQFQHEQAESERDGLVPRIWSALFGKKRKVSEVVAAPIIPAYRTIEVDE